MVAHFFFFFFFFLLLTFSPIWFLPSHVPPLHFGKISHSSFIWLDCPHSLWLVCRLLRPSQHGRALIWCITTCWISRAWSAWAVAAASLVQRAARTFQRTRTMTVYGRLTLTGWGRFPVRAAAPTSPTRTKLPHLYYLTSFTLVCLFIYLIYFLLCFIYIFIYYIYVFSLACIKPHSLSSLCTYPNLSSLPRHPFHLLFWRPFTWSLGNSPFSVSN